MYEDWSQWQPTRQNAYTSGLGGSSGVQDGQLYISSGDRSRAEARYYEEKAQKDEDDYRQGRRQDYIQVQNSRATAKQKANEAANGGRTESMFTRPESEANWAELNGPKGDGPSKYLPEWMKRYNTGETWQGFQAGAAPLGGGEGGGELPSGIRESSYTTNGGRTELISNMPGGQIQRYNAMPDGSIRSGGMVNSPFTAFSGDQFRQQQSTAGGYAGLPTSQQPTPQVVPQAVPNVRNYGWDSTGGVEQDAFPTPYQMRGDYASGRFENVTEDSYDPAPPDEWMQTRKGPSSWSDQYQTPAGPVRLTGTEPMSDELPPPDQLERHDDWAEEDEDAGFASTNDQIKESVNQRAEGQATGDPTKDQEAELERQRTVKALDDYSKRGFLPGYRAEDGSRRPSDVSVYGNKRESGMVRRVGEPLVDVGSSIASGAKQIAGRTRDAAKQVFDFDGVQLNEDPRFTDVRTNVRSDGRMSRQEAMSNGDILTPQEQDAVEQFKLRQILDQVEHLQSSALAPQNPRIAMDAGGRRDFNEDFNSTRTHDRATDPIRAGQIEAEMEGVKKSPRTGAKGDVPRSRPMTHRDVLAQYFSQALGGGIG